MALITQSFLHHPMDGAAEIDVVSKRQRPSMVAEAGNEILGSVVDKGLSLVLGGESDTGDHGGQVPLRVVELVWSAPDGRRWVVPVPDEQQLDMGDRAEILRYGRRYNIGVRFWSESASLSREMVLDATFFRPAQPPDDAAIRRKPVFDFEYIDGGFRLFRSAERRGLTGKKPHTWELLVDRDRVRIGKWIGSEVDEMVECSRGDFVAMHRWQLVTFDAIHDVPDLPAMSHVTRRAAAQRMIAYYANHPPVQQSS